jgi:hypothetical protein
MVIVVITIIYSGPFTLLYGPLPHEQGHSRRRAVSVGNYPRDSSWHVEVRLTLVLWARGSPVTVPTLKPMQVARL